jgi:methyl-accepting chemotaxis protein
MEKVVQQNAANAEESAAASEELNAQAEQMKSYVQDLVAVVGASGRKGTHGKFIAKVKRHKDKRTMESASEALRPESGHALPGRGENGKAKGMPQPNERPDKAISFDEEFTEF